MRALAAGLLLAFATLPAVAQTAPAPHASFYRIGAASDAKTHPQAGYALMGGGTDQDEAFRWLEKGYEQRSSGMPYLPADVFWSGMRSDPRYADLLRRMASTPPSA